MTIKELENKIKETYPELRIKGLLKKRKETLKEFITKFFTKWNNEKPTIFVNEEDYYGEDKDMPGYDPSIQCDVTCRRSIGDIYMICKYYYPRCTLNQVKTLMFGELNQSIPRFRSSYCSETKRRMFYQGNDDEPAAIYNETTKDEFGLKISDWKAL